MLKSIKIAILPLSLLIIHCSLLIVLSSCSTTSTEYGDLSGTVILNNDTGDPALDPADFSGVTVAVYPLAALDPVITGLNSSHPNIGVHISQETEFDHRLQNPVKLTATGANGSFNISKIPTGKYNLVIMKEGWGVRYLYDISITKGDNALNQKNYSSFIINYSLNARSQFNKSAVELYPVTLLSGYVDDDFEFKAGHSYIVTENTDFTAGVILSPASYIWIAPVKKISFYSQVATPAMGSELVRITSSDAMYGTDSSPAGNIQRYLEVAVTEFAGVNQNILSSLSVTFGNTGLRIKIPNLTVNHMVLRYNNNGIMFEQTDASTLTNCNIQNAEDNEFGGITFYDCTNNTSSNLVFRNCRIGIRQQSCENAAISNCFFQDNALKDVYNLYDNYCEITNCTFENSNIAIDNSGVSTTLVEYCDINARIGLYNYAQTNWVTAYFTANNNNFDCSQHGIKTFAVFYTEYHFNATINYWGTTNSSVISGDLIYDRYDVDPNDQDYYRLWGIIDYLPFRTAKIPNAGIVND